MIDHSDRAPEAGFEALEHTADLKIRAWAPDLRGLIEQAALGMVSLLVEAPLRPTSHVEIRGAGENAEETLVDCLREILLLPELEGLMPVSAQVLDAHERGARCSVGVVPVEAAAEHRGQDIKAVTYHDLRIRQLGDRLEVHVVFDV
jgi:SHS2 domain-containing protein